MELRPPRTTYRAPDPCSQPAPPPPAGELPRRSVPQPGGVSVMTHEASMSTKTKTPTPATSLDLAYSSFPVSQINGPKLPMRSLSTACARFSFHPWYPPPIWQVSKWGNSPIPWPQRSISYPHRPHRKIYVFRSSRCMQQNCPFGKRWSICKIENFLVYVGGPPSSKQIIHLDVDIFYDSSEVVINQTKLCTWTNFLCLCAEIWIKNACKKKINRPNYILQMCMYCCW